MKKNKKAILAMLVTMIMSLGMMGGINGNSQDSSLQQVSATAGYFATQTEGWVSVALGATAAGTGYYVL
jgi:hypothetical protein